MAKAFEVIGRSSDAPFSLKVRRGEGMALISMNWRRGRPPRNFVGFAIECRPPGEKDYHPLRNRLSFAGPDGEPSDADGGPSTDYPIQKFRWVHFPFDAEVDGRFSYRVTPAFMADDGSLSFGKAQTAAIELGGETYPGKLNVAFTRGFVSSQAFVDEFERYGEISTLIPASADDGLGFEPTHPKASRAFEWMGFEARRAILDLLDRAIADPGAEVRVVAYDFNLPEILERLERLGPRVKAIIDNSGSHGERGSAENAAAAALAKSAGADHVKRQHMGKLQHNKTIAVDGPEVKGVVCGSTNLSWRGLYVQSNNAVVLEGRRPVQAFIDAFEDYWEHDDPSGFGASPAAELASLGISAVDASVGFSPHSTGNALLRGIADDVATAESSLLYSLAFLYQTPGSIREAIEAKTADDSVFVYGISDRKVGGLDLQTPAGNLAPVYPSALTKGVPEPFKSEPTGGSGARMHHKFLVVDFDRPSARVYLGSYNFSATADTKNGENMVLIRDPRVAASYAIEALRIFDHYHFRVVSGQAKKEHRPLVLAKPPSEPGQAPWWEPYYTEAPKLRDRKAFA